MAAAHEWTVSKMADILIKGMEMPKDCPMCPLAHWNKLDMLTGCELGHRYVSKSDVDYWQSGVRPDWCPLAELEPVYKKGGRRYIFAMWAEVPKHYPIEASEDGEQDGKL